MEKQIKRIVAFILSFVMLLLMPFTNGYVTETKAGVVEPVLITETDSVVIHFSNPFFWSTAYAYALDDEGKELLGSWPGMEISNNAQNKGWYTFEVSNDKDFEILFNYEHMKSVYTKINAATEEIDEVWIVMTTVFKNDEFDTPCYYTEVSMEAPEGWIYDGGDIPVEPVEPVEPEEPVEPVEPIEPVEPQKQWDYELLENGTIKITDYSGDEASVAIPSQIDGYTVTAIGVGTFYYNQLISSLFIPETITSIEYGAVGNCTGLTSIEVDEDNKVYDSRSDCNAIIDTAKNELIVGCKNTIIPEGIVKIGDSAFLGCLGLTGIEIPESVTSLGERSFECTGLTSVVLPKSVTSIGEIVFDGCPNLKSVEIPGVTYISKAAFSYCPKLTSIKFSDSLTGIGEYAFSACEGLTSIDFPSGLLYIEWYAFAGCAGLKSIKIPSGVTSIGGWAFASCTSLESIEFPSGLRYIGQTAFNNCKNLTSIELPEALAYLDYSAFSYCSKLTSIKIPANVMHIAEGAFENCESLSSITVDENNKTYDSRNDCNAIIETENNSLIQGCKNTKIPQGITEIRNAAFSGCIGLTSIDIPEGVRDIEDTAFYGCTNLTNISIQNGLKNIGFHSFSHCESLRSIELPYGVEYIDRYAFFSCENLESIIIPDTVTTIGEGAFEDCSNLVIYAFEDSLVHKYALENGIKWEKIEIINIQTKGKITLDKTTYTYDGKTKTPAVTVKVEEKVLVAGKDYTLAYSNNKNSGIATVTVTGKGYYTGVIKKEFSINPSAVKDFTYSARSSSAVALKWTKNTSASGYVIEQYKGGKWVVIKTITNNATTSYKATSLSASTANKFRIKAYKTVGSTKLYSGYTSKTINTLPAGVKNFTYSARSSSAVALKWTKNTSASGYVIEQYKSGKWVVIKTITSNATTSCKVTGLKASTANKFRIKAYKSYGSTKLYSGYVSKSINTLPSGVAGFTYSARTKNTITLKWNKNTSATGYVIEQYKNGKWVAIKTVSKNSTVSYKVSGLNKATSYKFRIKAYKSYGSSKLYSGYVTKTIKTK